MSRSARHRKAVRQDAARRQEEAHGDQAKERLAQAGVVDSIKKMMKALNKEADRVGRMPEGRRRDRGKRKLNKRLAAIQKAKGGE